MKKLLFVLFTFLCTATASAQYVPEWHRGDLKMKGGKIAVRGEKLDKAATLALVDQVGGPALTASWEKYTKKRGWGIGLTAGGYTLAAAGLCFGGVYFVAAIVGSIFVAIGGQEAVDKLWADMGPRVGIGGGVMLAGLAAGTTGVVLLSSGNRNLRKITATCDAAGAPSPAPATQLTFGSTPSGVGLALRF